MADVSGKGGRAALYMVLARTLLRTHALTTDEEHQAVLLTNGYLTDHYAQLGLFVSVFYAVYDPKDHLLTYVNAGHNPPLLFHGDTGEVEWLQPTDMIVGIVPGRAYEPHTQSLRSGDVLVLYTDGVTEARSVGSEEDFSNMFGEEGLASVVRAHHMEEPKRLLAHIEARLASP